MKFLVDAQLPRTLALWLQEEGHDALHTLELPLANRTPDAEIIATAEADGRIVVTKYADFISAFQIHGVPSRLLLVSTGNISNVELLQLWHRHLGAIIRAFDGAEFVELTPASLIIHS